MLIGRFNLEVRFEKGRTLLVAENVPDPGLRGGVAIMTTLTAPEQLEALAEHLRFEAGRWRRETTPRPVKDAVLDEALKAYKPGRRSRHN